MAKVPLPQVREFRFSYPEVMQAPASLGMGSINHVCSTLHIHNKDLKNTFVGWEEMG